MIIEDGIHVINTDQAHSPEVSDTLIEGRQSIVNVTRKLNNNCLVNIFLLAYGRLEKTKRCVESILKYTKGIDFNIILVDNGSEDNFETIQYFKDVSYEKKYIYRVTKNLGPNIATLLCCDGVLGKYLVVISNDIIVTENWLSNILEIMDSDSRIGMVCPVSSNISNLQEINLNFSNIKEMQEKAAVFNVCDPKKWQERIRLMNPIGVYRVEMLIAFGGKLPVDYGFFHDFGDDDLSFAIRRAGYKLVLAGDTWVHHDHDFRNMEDKDPEEFSKSLEIGRQNFMEKYQGIDAWEDVNNYWFDITPHIPNPVSTEKKYILGVDTRCGTPILDVKNRLRNFGIFDAELSAFTQSAKYVVDLNTICSGVVACDREEFLADQFLPNYFDYIVVDRPLNRYHEPQKILNDLMRLLKPGGLLMVPVLNTFTFHEFFYCQGRRDLYNREFAYNIPPEAVQAALEKFGTVQFTVPRYVNIDEQSKQYISSILPKELSQDQKRNCLQRLLIDKFIFGVKKN